MESDPTSLGIKDRCPRCGYQAYRTDRLQLLEVSKYLQRNGNSRFCENCNITF